MRDMVNAILVSTAYNPLFAGDYSPTSGSSPSATSVT